MHSNPIFKAKIQNQRIKLSLILLFFFIIATYAPLIMYGGIIVDDWGDISHNLHCASFIDCYGNWFPLFSNRPLAPLPITALTFVFEKNYSCYLIANSFIYLLAIFFCAKVVNEISVRSTAIIFCALASIPIIAMPLISSPINQSTATVSFLLWSLSLLFLQKFLRTSSIQSIFISYIWLLLAFLTYEVILPLLVFNLLLPYIVKPEAFIKKPFQYVFRYFLPLLLVLLIVTAWQKGIAPQFIEVDSRLKFQPSHIIPKIHTWADVFYNQVPTLFWKLPQHLDFFNALTGCLLIALIWLNRSRAVNSTNQNSMEKRFALVSLLTLIASSSIFILSDESAVSSGYQARGLSSTWFAFSLFFAAAYALIKRNNYFLNVPLVCFCFFCSLSYGVQRNQYIQSWQIQSQIIEDIYRLIKDNRVTAPAVIIGNVPKYLENNYNDEIIFSQPWDFGAALALNTNGIVVDGFPIDIKRNDLRLIQADIYSVSGQNWIGSNYENLWFYDYDSKIGEGTLIQVLNKNQLLNLIKKNATN